METSKQRKPNAPVCLDAGLDMTTSAAETPETDAEANSEGQWRMSDSVSADFARSLERRLRAEQEARKVAERERDACRADAERIISALRSYADSEYCKGIRMATHDAGCLGWAAKVKAGQFGTAEMAAHEKMNKHMGAHYGIYSAIDAAMRGRKP